jgi:hypothetical protein
VPLTVGRGCNFEWWLVASRQTRAVGFVNRKWPDGTAKDGPTGNGPWAVDLRAEVRPLQRRIWSERLRHPSPSMPIMRRWTPRPSHRVGPGPASQNGQDSRRTLQLATMGGWHVEDVRGVRGSNRRKQATPVDPPRSGRCDPVVATGWFFRRSLQSAAFIKSISRWWSAYGEYALGHPRPGKELGLVEADQPCRTI